MSFTNKLTQSFGKSIEHSQWVALESIVKCNYISKGRNLIFGRTSQSSSTDDLLYIGKVLETATGTSLLGADAWLDTKFPHVIYITGTRGSGKSMDLGIIIEGLASLNEKSAIQNNITPVTTFLIDTQSQFWTLKYPPAGTECESQLEDLSEWNIKPNFLSDCKVFIPKQSVKFMGDELPLVMRPRDVLHEEWCALLGQDVYSPQGHLLADVLEKLGGDNFSIEDIISQLREGRLASSVAESSRNVLIYRLTDYNRTGLFDPDGLSVEELLVPGRSNVFMLRDLRDEDKALVTAILSRQLFTIMGRYHQQRRVSNFLELMSWRALNQAGFGCWLTRLTLSAQIAAFHQLAKLLSSTLSVEETRDYL